MKVNAVERLIIQERITSDHTSFQNYYPDGLVSGNLGVVKKIGVMPDWKLIDRIMDFYAYSIERRPTQASGVWATINKHKENVHNALLSGDRIEVFYFLSQPANSMLMHGFDFPTSHSIKNIDSINWLQNYRSLCLGALRRLAEALAAMPLVLPEAYGIASDVCSNKPISVDDLIRLIIDKLGIALEERKVFESELGLEICQSVVSYRAIQSIFQASRIKSLLLASNCSIADSPVLEIGGGTGRTAYYAYLLGLRNYSLVDLPISAVVQAYYLGMQIGGNNIWLEGEPEKQCAIKIYLPDTVLGSNKVLYKLIANFDSLVEFSLEDAEAYIEFILANSAIFLSVNRESKEFSVNSLLLKRGVNTTRTPYWLRQGYVEEIVSN
jgi:hypothetical protein